MTDYDHQKKVALRAFDKMRDEESSNKDKLLIIDLAEGLTIAFISAAANFERIAKALETANQMQEPK